MILEELVSILLEASKQEDFHASLDLICTGLAEQSAVALARIWLKENSTQTYVLQASDGQSLKQDQRWRVVDNSAFYRFKRW